MEQEYPGHGGILIAAGLRATRDLIIHIESKDEFDALAQSWLNEYKGYRSEAIDHQILQLIRADWLQQRAMMTILRVEFELASAERHREDRERLDFLHDFLARMNRRLVWYQRLLRAALRTLEQWRHARQRQKLTELQIKRVEQRITADRFVPQKSERTKQELLSHSNQSER